MIFFRCFLRRFGPILPALGCSLLLLFGPRLGGNIGLELFCGLPSELAGGLLCFELCGGLSAKFAGGFLRFGLAVLLLAVALNAGCIQISR